MPAVRSASFRNCFRNAAAATQRSTIAAPAQMT